MNKETVSREVDHEKKRSEPRTETIDLPFQRLGHIVAKSAWEARALQVSNRDAKRIGRIIYWPGSLAA
jgi:hypothetical protein